MQPAIRIEDLSKLYRLGTGPRGEYRTLRETIAGAAGTPFRFAGSLLPRAVRPKATAARGADLLWALRDVALEVQPGEVVGVIGRNGAGKSTLLKILSRITAPTTGRVRLRGRVGSLLEVGTGFHPELTGRENVYLNGAILGMTRREIARKFDDIVAFAEIERFLDTPVKRYSSGMYVRLAFAVAAHLEPEILLVDEVLAVGDAQFQEKCLGSLRKKATGGRTVLFVSHNMASIQHLCTRTLLFKHGRVVKDGAPDEVIGAYLSDAHRDSVVDLTDWPDRVTSGEARITRLRISDAQDRATDTVRVGGTACFIVRAVFHKAMMDPSFCLLIHTSAGEPLLDLRSIHDGLRLGRVQGELEVRLRLDNIGLYPGEYLLSPWISDSFCRRNVDWPRFCCSLRVEQAPGPHGDLFLDSRFGRYWVPSQWTCERAPSAAAADGKGAQLAPDAGLAVRPGR